MRRVKKYPPLTIEQQKLVESHMYLSIFIAKKVMNKVNIYSGCFTLQDFESIGFFALCVCAGKYNGEKAEFKTYAWNTIKGYIYHALRDKRNSKITKMDTISSRENKRTVI